MAMPMRIFLIAGLCIVGNNASYVNQSFSEYIQAFGKDYMVGSAEHQMREKIFSQRMAEILAHNAQGRSWKMGLNQFTDHTDAELQALRGYRRQHTGTNLIQGTSVMQLTNENDDRSCGAKDQSCSNARSCCGGLICGASGNCEQPAGATEAMDWSSKISTSMEVYNQGPCGSCWAVAAAAAVQLLAAKENPKFSNILSPENINKCAPNPLSCGGTGGCGGSTPGLAFEYLKSLAPSKQGLTTMKNLAYTAQTSSTIPESSCPSTSSSFLENNLRSGNDNWVWGRKTQAAPSVIMNDWVKVKENHAENVMNSLVSVGPLAVAVVGHGIQGYSSGIIDSCKSAVIDHAVVMMGYGKDPSANMLYWNIRNSWGKEWGEKGFFRVQRHYAPGTKTSGNPMTDDNFHGEPCAWDNDPAKGVACKDDNGKYPTRTRVCGECGIVSDVAHPTGITVNPRLLSV
jgi:C1A family cysteine protease